MTADFRAPISAFSFQLSAFSFPGQRRSRLERVDRVHVQDRDLTNSHDLSTPRFFVGKIRISSRKGFDAEILRADPG